MHTLSVRGNDREVDDDGCVPSVISWVGGWLQNFPVSLFVALLAADGLQPTSHFAWRAILGDAHTPEAVVTGSQCSLRVPPPRKGPSPEDPRQCESVGINSDRRGPWGMVACGGGNE